MAASRALKPLAVQVDLHAVVHRRVRAEFVRETRRLVVAEVDRVRERGDLLRQRRLAVREGVVCADRREVELDVGVAAANAGLLGELRERIAARLVNPGAAEVDRNARQVDGVRAAADPRAPLQQHVLDSCVPERVGQGQPGPAGAHDDDPLRVARGTAGNRVASVVVLLGLRGKGVARERTGEQRPGPGRGGEPHELAPRVFVHRSYSASSSPSGALKTLSPEWFGFPSSGSRETSRKR